MLKIKRLLDSIFNLFRGKDYYEVRYEDLNNCNCTFNVVTDDVQEKIKLLLNKLNNTSVWTERSKLHIKDARAFSGIDDLMQEILIIINIDYRDTYFEAINENWNFNYFFSNRAELYDETLVLNNRIEKVGSVIYPLLAIRKDDNIYHLWNLLD